jgi:protease-4
MSRFFKFVFASCLGVFLAMGVLVLIGLIVGGRAASQASKTPKLKPNSILVVSLDQPIPERTNNLEMNPFDFKNDQTPGLHELVEAIQSAGKDDKIKGIFLDLESFDAGRVTAANLHDALLDFKKDGKFIVAYSKAYTQGTYYLASTADKVYLNPIGMVDFRGYASVIPMFKRMFDKLGVEMQIFYAGDFKGATEPFRLEKLSEPNKLQIREFLNDMFNNYLEDVSANRNIPVDSLRAIANTYRGRNAEGSLASGLVDELVYRDEVVAALRTRLGLSEDAKIPQISLNEYLKASGSKKDFSAKDKIAVIYAEGNIIDGNSQPGSIGDFTYASLIRKAREDDRVKAVVLRVNSGGGSGFASENILRELQLVQESGRPLIVSMGDFAASGGYYISAFADTIFAEPNTLTGSIGVFSIIPNMSGLLNDKMGIQFDTVTTGPASVGITPFFDLGTIERETMQELTVAFYEQFLQRVAEGRGMSRDEVHAVAQGRVWTGNRALEIGLVDRIGGLDAAIASAASMAKLEKYRTVEFPAVKDPLQLLIEELTGQKDDKELQIKLLEKHLGDDFHILRMWRHLQQAKGPQALMPLHFQF